MGSWDGSEEVSAGEKHLKTASLGEGGLAEPVGTGHTRNNGEALCPTPGAGIHQWDHVKQKWGIPGLLHAFPERVTAAAGPPGERLWVLPLLCECSRPPRHQKEP